MASTPKFSLIERLVQDRLRSGELEASTAHLLRLGEIAPGDPTREATPDVASVAGPSAMTTGNAGMNLLPRSPPIVALRGTSLQGNPVSADAAFPAGISSGLRPTPAGPTQPIAHQDRNSARCDRPATRSPTAPRPIHGREAGRHRNLGRSIGARAAAMPAAACRSAAVARSISAGIDCPGPSPAAKASQNPAAPARRRLQSGQLPTPPLLSQTATERATERA